MRLHRWNIRNTTKVRGMVQQKLNLNLKNKIMKVEVQTTKTLS